MNKLTILKNYIPKPKANAYQCRYLTSTQCISFKTRNTIDKNKIDNSETLMQDAPKWDEADATESEADIKADREPIVSPDILNQESTEWVRSHKDKDGNIPPQ